MSKGQKNKHATFVCFQLSTTYRCDSSRPYLCLLIRSLLFHLIQSLQHPAKVSHPEVETNSLVVLPGSTEKQLPQFRINFAFFFWRELFFPGCDHSTKAEKMKVCKGCRSLYNTECLHIYSSSAHVFFSIDLKS